MKQINRIHRGTAVRFDEALQRATGLNPDETALLIQMGGAYLGKYRCKDAGCMVKDGQEIGAWYRLPLVMEKPAFQAGWIKEDKHGVLVADKPAGLPTQGRRDADYMAFYELLKENVKGYVGLHHRLDQDTSGLMLFTRRKELNTDAARLFQERRACKEYLAVVTGEWQGPDEQRLQQPIGTRRGPRGSKQEVNGSGKKADTSVTRLFSAENLHLVRAQPHTGRTHQIRVHLSHLGLPLLGDTFYGGPEHNGFYLHCFHLCWPQTGKLKAGDHRSPPPQTWRQHLPAALNDFLDQWWEDPC